nr:thrombospondin type 3 repeat-containing protein [Solirubrobacter phytolaccae]
MQEDDNHNGVGNLCEFDTDRDGHFDTEDNCPNAPNPDQSDLDSDRVGDVCDNDDDGDYTRDGEDNCPLIPNPDQLDADADGIGAMCDDNDTPPAPPDPTPVPTVPGSGDGGPDTPGGGTANVNDRQAPRVTVRVAFSPRVDEVQDGLVVRVTCSEACAAKAALTVSKATSRKLKLRSGLTTVGSGEASLEAAASTYAFVRFDARAKARLLKAKRTELTLKLTITDPSGNVRRVSESLSLRR